MQIRWKLHRRLKRAPSAARTNAQRAIKLVANNSQLESRYPNGGSDAMSGVDRRTYARHKLNVWHKPTRGWYLQLVHTRRISFPLLSSSCKYFRPSYARGNLALRSSSLPSLAGSRLRAFATSPRVAKWIFRADWSSLGINAWFTSQIRNSHYFAPHLAPRD